MTFRPVKSNSIQTAALIDFNDDKERKLVLGTPDVKVKVKPPKNFGTVKYCRSVCKYASMQVFKYASMQVCKYASMQIFKYASMPEIANGSLR